MPTVFNGFASSAGALLAGETSGLGIDFLASLPTLYSESSNTLMNYYGTPFKNDGGKIDFSRASLATTTDVDGNIKWSPHNLLLASEQFDAGNWTKTNSTITANSTAAPNGTTTADALYETATTGGHSILQSTASAVSNCTVSTYVKANGRTWVLMVSGGAHSGYWFDLGAGTVGSAAPGTGTTSSPLITPVGNGWYYISYKTTAATGIIIYTATGDNIASYAGDITKGLYIWGASIYLSDLGGMQANGSAYPYYNSTTPKNLLGYTESFNNAYWLKYSVAVPATKYADPYGGTTANLLYPTAATTDAALYKGGFPSVSKTHSYFVKAAGKTWFCILKEGTSGGAAWFNLLTGLVGTVAAGYTAPNPVSLGNGWYRCSVTSTSGFSQYTAVSAVDADNSTTPTPNGTDGVYIWGAQLSDSASIDPYVPNFGAAPTAAAYYGPRIDYDGANLGTAKGLLIEEQRTNLVLRSQEFNNAYWVLSNLNAFGSGSVANTTATLDLCGTNTADFIQESTATSQHGLYTAVGLAASPNTFSVYCKAGTRNWVYVRLAVTTGQGAYFNLSTGVVGTVESGITAAIYPAGNGWYRCSVTITTTAQAWYPSVNIAPSDNTTSYTGDGTSGLYIWGAQLEAGSFATSYIPTAASTVTRSADVPSVGTGQFPYNSTEGTIVVSSTTMVNNNTGLALNLTDGIASRIQIASETSYQFAVVNSAQSPTIQASLDGGTPSYTGGINKAAGVYKNDDFALSFNGGTVATDASGTVPSGITTMFIGTLGSNSFVQNGHIRQVTYIPRRLTNVELQQKTSA